MFQGATRRQVILAAPATLATARLSASPKKSSNSKHSAAAYAVIRAMQSRNPTPGLSIAVADPSDVIWETYTGKADLELGVATTPEHRFKLGSVGKVLTSTAAAKLASRGILSLDAPISRWLDNLPEQHRQTTLRQLLTHRGGVRHYQDRDFSTATAGGRLDQRSYPSNKEILDTFINDPLVAAPGKEVHYSTFGYTLASIVMEVASAVPFPKLMEREIGLHFGLPSLDVDDPFALKPWRVRGYGPARNYTADDPRVAGAWANARQNNPAYKWAGGGFIMTPRDLAKFGAAMIESRYSKITNAERALLFTPVTEAAASSPPLGLGWRVNSDIKGRLRWHHAGAQEGCRASLVIYPESRLSIALATNATSIPDDVLGISSGLADALIA